ncbi:hypothetical protein ACSQ67_015762 [Phaseolus vulgaris]
MEIECIIGKDRMVMELDIDNLPYLQAIVKVAHTTLAAMIECFEWKEENCGCVDMKEEPHLFFQDLNP